MYCLQAINDNDIHNVVISYLVHNCYKETAESFIACTGMKQSADHIEDMERRKSKQFSSGEFIFDVDEIGVLDKMRAN